MEEKASRSLIIYGDRLVKQISSSHIHLHDLASRGCSDFLSLTQSPNAESEDERVVRELAQLLDAYVMKERDVRDIEIPNIRWEMFELMMRFIYMGSVDVTLDITQDLIRAEDQYLLEGLKRLCEYVIAHDVSLQNNSSMYELSKFFAIVITRHMHPFHSGAFRKIQ